MSRLALFLATSGHSGVDRLMNNLVSELGGQGVAIDLLGIRGHGPDYAENLPACVRRVDLGVSHINSSLLPLRRYLRSERPAALLCDKDRVNRIALLARRLSGVPVRVVIRTGTTVSRDLASRGAWQRTVQRISMRMLYRFADAIVVPSEGARDDLARVAGLPAERIRRVPSPLIPADLAVRAANLPDTPWLHDSNTPLVLGAGELCARKDFATLVRAFALLREQRRARLVILGEGRRRAELEALVRERGLSGDVLLPGFSANVYGWMSRAAVFGASSRWEGLSQVIVEAMALGVPVVSTDCPSGPAELLQGGRLGVLTPLGDASEMARGLAEMLDRPTPAARLRAAVNEYQVAASAAAYLAVWRGT